MGVGILAKRVVLELGSSTNFVYSLRRKYAKYLRFLYSWEIQKFPCTDKFEPFSERMA